MAGITGYTAPTNGDAPEGPEQMEDIYEHFDPLIGEKVATAASLPVSGNWPGRSILAEDTGAQYVYLGGWVLTRYTTTPFFAATGAATASTSGVAITWTVQEDPLSMWSGANPTRITFVRAGVYRIVGRIVQSGIAALDARGRISGATLSDSIRDTRVGTTGVTASPVLSALQPFSAGQYLEIITTTTTGTIPILATTHLSVEWVRPIGSWVP